jgi:hypothetical protein
MKWMTPRAARLPLAATLLAALPLACAGLGPKRVTTRSQTDRLSIPYPVGEPVKEHSGPRLALAASAYLRVTEADPDDAAATPWLTTHLLAPGTAERTDVLELLPRLDRMRASTTELEREVLEKAGIEWPGDSVMLVSAEGPCRASVGTPSVVVSDDPDAAVVVQWPLAGCDARPLAPVALLTDRLPDALRWTPATRTVDVTLLPGTPWQDSRENIATHPEWGGGGLPTARVVQVWEVPDVSPLVMQIYDALVLRTGDEPEPCLDRVAWAQTNGLYRGDFIDAFEPSDEPSATPHLIGAFTHDGLLDAPVYLDHDQPLVAVPPVQTGEGDPTPWTYHYAGPLDAAALRQDWGWSPATGTTGFTPVCPGGADVVTATDNE